MLDGYPGFVPGLALSVVAGLIAGRPIGRAFGITPRLAAGLVLSLGIVLSATLTPSPEGINYLVTGSGNLPHHHLSCDFTGIGVSSWEELLAVNDASLNVLLFVPLGLTVGLLRSSQRKTTMVVAAMSLPFTIEAIQVLVVPLDRSCETGDLIDNLIGLGLGLAVGLVWWRIWVRPPTEPRN